MAKNIAKKKINRKTKRRIRKTTAALLLISAITVAAIPVPGAEAHIDSDTVVEDGHDHDLETKDGNAGSSYVPLLESDTTIYRTGDNTFRFAVWQSNNYDRVAVLLGYNASPLPDGKLIVPETLEAYVNYTNSKGTNLGQAAANIHGQPLYYKAVTTATLTGSGVKNEEGSWDYSWSVQYSETPVVETSTNKNQLSSTIGAPVISADEKTATQTITFNTYKYLPCAADYKKTWDVDGEIYYLYNYSKLSDTVSGGNGSGKDGYSSDYWEYKDLPPISANEEKWPWLKNIWNQIELSENLIDKGDTAHNYFTETKTDEVWLNEVKVGVISNQRATVKQDGSIHLDSDPESNNFFSGNSAGITSIEFPKTLFAIADNSLSGCTNLTSVEFESGSLLAALGESAFENCNNLESFILPKGCEIKTIGQRALANCGSLKSFTFPDNVSTICNEAFYGCNKLESLTFSTSTSNVTEIGNDVFSGCAALSKVVLPTKLKDTGCHLFQNCTNLQEVTLPNNPDFNDLYFSDFQGCPNLKWIDVKHDNTTFITKEEYEFNVDDFKTQVGEEFYFIGSGNDICKIHNGITTEYEIAFMYRDSENFEVVKSSESTDGSTVKLSYLASKSGELLGITINPAGTAFEADVPSSVGPYPITGIGSDFKGNSDIVSLTVPDTVNTIAEAAFQGCYRLKTVTFKEPNKITAIGPNAFDTQLGSEDKSVTPLTFYGAINVNSKPFIYATTEGNNINNTNQTETYIDFCSGNPTNIHVRYNSETKKREVWKVPKKTDKEYKDAIKEAVENSDTSTVSGGDPSDSVDTIIAKYEDYIDKGGAFPYSDNIRQAVASAYNIVLPTGIQALADDLFSDATLESTREEYKNALSGATFYENASKPGGFDANKDIRSITMYDVEALDDFAFYGCDKLKTVVMFAAGAENGESIGDYAFAKCPALTDVTLPNTTSTMGTRPFAGDEEVIEVKFTGEAPASGGTAQSDPNGVNFSSDRGIVYEMRNGSKYGIVQCLENRGNKVGSTMVGPSEFSGISILYPEAFMNCQYIGSVDLSKTLVDEIPDYTFANDTKLTSLILPSSGRTVGEYALKDTYLTVLRVPSSNTSFDNTTFYSEKDEPEDKKYKGHVINDVEVVCAEGSMAERLAERTYNTYGWFVSDELILPTYTITFVDDDGRTVIAVRRDIPQGEEVPEPTEEEMAPFLEKHVGKYFDGWLPGGFSPAGRDMYVQANYTDTKPVEWSVTYVNDNLTVIRSGKVEDGKSAREFEPPAPSSTQGDYKFTSWYLVELPTDDPANPVTIDHITRDATIMAQYDHTMKGDGTPIYPGGTSGNNPNDPNNPNNPNGGNTNNPNGGNTNNPNGGNTNNPNGGNNNNDDDKKKEGKYEVEVINGKGSGKYDKDDIVTIEANVIEGYEFVNWTTTYKDLKFTSDTANKTGFLMPESNVVVTANYKFVGVPAPATTAVQTPAAATGGSANTGSVTRVPSSSGSNDNDNSRGNRGSSVEVNRNGISDTTKASATVNGSTDNFVVKVSENGQATAAVAEALRNKYGDLSNIRYFAMDIALYDETGTTEITDTSGLSVTITLPIPDELRQYAGNNQVGAVSSGNQLEDLTPRFSTVDGTPCVTFTASHFSPYTIYADTANLSDGSFDSTPRTGDGIHPKWFLAVGLAMLSAVLFLKKDKKAAPTLG